METGSPGEIEQSAGKLLQDLQAVVHDAEALLKAGAQDLSERGMAARVGWRRRWRSPRRRGSSWRNAPGWGPR